MCTSIIEGAFSTMGKVEQTKNSYIKLSQRGQAVRVLEQVLLQGLGRRLLPDKELSQQDCKMRDDEVRRDC